MYCVTGTIVATVHPTSKRVFLSKSLSYVNGEVWDEFQLQLDDVAQQLQLLRSRVSSLSRTHEQHLLDEPEAAQRQ